MTDQFRAMCAELLAWAEHTSTHYYKQPDVLDRARALLASSVDQDDATLKFIRGCIDTRMNIIWSALNSDTEILESVSLPEKLPPCENS